jgi:hypothetical protein
MTFKNINGSEEEIEKFVSPLYDDDTPTEFFAYDYDTIEGIDHIISELDLENKTDDSSVCFLLRLQGRQHYLHYHSEEGKKAGVERRKRLKDIKFLEGFVLMEEVVENLEKKQMYLESEYDEFMEIGRQMRSLHNDTEFENYKQG